MYILNIVPAVPLKMLKADFKMIKLFSNVKINKQKHHLKNKFRRPEGGALMPHNKYCAQRKHHL